MFPSRSILLFLLPASILVPGVGAWDRTANAGPQQLEFSSVLQWSPISPVDSLSKRNSVPQASATRAITSQSVHNLSPQCAASRRITPNLEHNPGPRQLVANVAPCQLMAKYATRWLVAKSSTLRIEGRTNINKFCCQVSRYDGPDTIAVCGVAAAANIPMRGQLSIAIDEFDCASRLMTKEFKKTLKYPVYPNLGIVFEDLERMPALGGNTDCLKGTVEVELAGICRRFVIDYAAAKKAEGEFDLTGEHDFSFTDFGLIPPSKMGGLVRVNDQLKVVFNLHLKNIE